MIKKFAILAIRGYQKFLSPIKGYKCAYGAAHEGVGGTCSSRGLRIFKKAQTVRQAFALLRSQFDRCQLAAWGLGAGLCKVEDSVPEGASKEVSEGGAYLGQRLSMQHRFKSQRGECDCGGCDGCDGSALNVCDVPTDCIDSRSPCKGCGATDYYDIFLNILDAFSPDCGSGDDEKKKAVASNEPVKKRPVIKGKIPLASSAFNAKQAKIEAKEMAEGDRRQQRYIRAAKRIDMRRERREQRREKSKSNKAPPSA